jgi:methylmalonyl-CoA mutase
LQATKLNPFPHHQLDEWKEHVLAGLKGKPLQSLVSKTDDDIEVAPLELASADATPIFGPRKWLICSRVDHPVPQTANLLAQSDLENGAEQLAIVFSGSSTARGFGVDDSSVRGLDEILRSVRLDATAFRLETKSSGRTKTEAFATLVNERNIDPARMSVDFGLDPIGTIAMSGSMSASWPESSKDLAGHIAKLRSLGFKGPFTCADGRIWHEAGATEAQELAATLATAVAFARLLTEHGVSQTQALQDVSFALAVDNDQFVSIAKVRAMHLLWNFIQSKCGVALVAPLIHVETSSRMLSRHHVQTNILRNSTAAFAAIIGGASSVAILPHTSAVGLPESTAREIARNMQLLLRHETDIWRSADPSAGSGSIERLTEDLADKAWSLFQSFEKRNSREPGIISALRDGTWQQAIAAAHQKRMDRLTTGKSRMIGVNAFVEKSHADVMVEDLAPKPPSAVTHEIFAQPLPIVRLPEPFESWSEATP